MITTITCASICRLVLSPLKSLRRLRTGNGRPGVPGTRVRDRAMAGYVLEREPATIRRQRKVASSVLDAIFRLRNATFTNVPRRDGILDGLPG